MWEDVWEDVVSTMAVAHFMTSSHHSLDLLWMSFTVAIK